jgi:hypothetical protein
MAFVAQCIAYDTPSGYWCFGRPTFKPGDLGRTPTTRVLANNRKPGPRGHLVPLPMRDKSPRIVELLFWKFCRWIERYATAMAPGHPNDALEFPKGHLPSFFEWRTRNLATHWGLNLNYWAANDAIKLASTMATDQYVNMAGRHRERRKRWQ